MAPPIPLNEVIDEIGVGEFHTRLLVACGLGFAAIAVECSMGGFLFVEFREKWGLSEHVLSYWPTVAVASSVAGKLFWGAIADSLGRRVVFLYTCLFVAVFGLASAFSRNFFEFVLLRGLANFGLGGNISVDFAMYIEFLPTAARNDKLFKLQSFWPLGQIMCCDFAWSLIPQFGWQGLVAAASVPNFFCMFLRPLMPESPRWLLVHGQSDEAVKVLREVAVINGRDPDAILPEGKSVTLDVSERTAINGTVGPREGVDGCTGVQVKANEGMLQFHRLFVPAMFTTTVGVVVYEVSVSSSSYCLGMLMPTLLEQKGFARQDIFCSMMLNACGGFLGIFGAQAVSTQWGRLPAMIFSFPALIIAMGLFVVAEHWVWIVAATSFAAAVNEGCWAIFHAYISEVFPTELRATAMGTTCALSKMPLIFLPMLTAHVLEQHNMDVATVMRIFTTICFAGMVGTWLLLRIETGNRDLEDTVSQTSSWGVS